MQHIRMRYAQDILATSSSQWPQHAAIIDRHGVCLYRELAGAAEQICSALVRTGVSEGCVVGIRIADASSFLAALFGVLQAGAIAVPVAPNLSEIERLHVMKESRVSWLVTARSLDERRNLADVVITPSPTGRLRLRQDAGLEPVRDLFPDAAIIRHTSGTTGQSKAVVLSHQRALERIKASCELLEVTHSDIVLISLSLSYHFIASAMACVLAGATIIDGTEATVSSPPVADHLRAASMIYASPSYYDLISRYPHSSTLPKLRRAISTSALLSKRTASAFFDRFNFRLTQVYGIIEVGLPLWNAFESVDPTTLGTCRTPYECSVVDSQGEPVALGQLGELRIRGPGMFSGYLFGGVGTHHHRCNDWFHTGDLVTQDALGLMVYHGRAKTAINCAGYRVFPEEIEEVLKLAPDVDEVRVSAVPDSQSGNQVIAEIVSSSASHKSVESWRALCQRELSEYKIPREFRLVESLPSTGSGKVARY